MIHAAITAVALSCSPITIHSEDTASTEEVTLVDFAGGSITDYVHEVATAFAESDARPNIVLLPGTDEVKISPVSIRVVRASDALAAIAGHDYLLDDGTTVLINFEEVGSDESILRVSGIPQYEQGSHRNSSARSSRSGRRLTEIDDRQVAILRVDHDRLVATHDLARTVLKLAGLLTESTILPMPEHGLMLVSTTEEGRALVEQVIFEVATRKERNIKPKESTTEHKEASTDSRSDRRIEIEAELKRISRLRSDDRLGAEERKRNSRRFAELLQEIRRMPRS